MRCFVMFVTAVCIFFLFKAEMAEARGPNKRRE